MTEENYSYRTSQTLLRNQFPGKRKWEIPIIPRFESHAGDFDDLLLIGFDKTHLEDQNHLDRMVHFFLYDYEHSDRKEDWDSFKIGGQISTSYDTISPFIDIPFKNCSNLMQKQRKVGI